MYPYITTVYQERRPRLESHLHYQLQRHTTRLTHFLFLLFLFALTSCDNGVAAQRKEGRTYPLLAAIPKTTFSCRGHTAGYYADPETGCQVYHMCDTLEKQYSYLCPNHTLFNQKFMVCDHWYMVNCSSATTFYDLNNHIGEIPNSNEGDDNGINTLGSGVKVLSTERSLNNSVKETNNAPVTFTFKAPVSNSFKPQLSTNSLVSTETPAKTTTTAPKVMTDNGHSLTSLKPMPTIANHSQPSSTSSKNRKNLETTVQPVTTPSRFFQPPKFESDFKFGVNLGLVPRPPPSVFLQPPNKQQDHSNLKSKTSSPPSVLLQPLNNPDSSEVRAFSPHDGSKEDISGTSSTTLKNNLRNHVNSTAELSIPSAQTPPPDTSFTMVPGIVARDPGNRFSFTSGRQKNPSFIVQEFQDLIFRPLIIRPKEKHRKIFTSAPASVTLDLHHGSEDIHDQDTQHSTATVFAAPLNRKSHANESATPPSSSAGVRVPSVLLQPSPFPPLTLNIPPFLPTLQQTLIPPPRMKQESITELVMPLRFTSGQTHHGSSRLVRFQFPVSRSNRDFFIPQAGVSPNDKNEGLSSSQKGNPTDHQNSLIHSIKEKKTNMTMIFPAPFDAKISALQINPNCPKCHPAFLRPGQCSPCVLIR